MPENLPTNTEDMAKLALYIFRYVLLLAIIYGNAKADQDFHEVRKQRAQFVTQELKLSKDQFEQNVTLLEEKIAKLGVTQTYGM